MSTHVLLGGGGVVGRETAEALLASGLAVSSFGRNPSSTPGVTSILGDLQEPADVTRAVGGAEVAYLVAGLRYSTRVWRREWPTVVSNAIQACRASGTRLVFFDNVYAYGLVEGAMTESTPIRPTSRKGEVRAELLRMLQVAAQRGLSVTIARGADFYGPGASTSVFNSMVLDKVARGKQPTWLLDANLPHSMTFTPDIGRALAVLGTDPRGEGGTWHLPTASALTGEDYLRIATGGRLRHHTMTLGTMRVGALFAPIAREALEMAYQNTAPYLFDSSAFESTFGVAATPYAEGIARALAAATD